MDANVAAVFVAAIAAGGTVVAAYIANAARKNTKTLGNGFASDVVHRLERIEGLIVDHLKDHAEADVTRHRRRP